MLLRGDLAEDGSVQRLFGRFRVGGRPKTRFGRQCYQFACIECRLLRLTLQDIAISLRPTLAIAIVPTVMFPFAILTSIGLALHIHKALHGRHGKSDIED